MGGGREEFLIFGYCNYLIFFRYIRVNIVMKWSSVMFCYGYVWLKIKDKVGENLEEFYIF